MNKEAERNIFLKHLADIYIQNPNFPIYESTIYDELRTFNIVDNNIAKISKDNLAPVQVALNNKYKNNKKVVSFPFNNGYFWVIENRNNKDDNKFYEEMENSIKLYIGVDKENLYQISSALFDFMIKEKITMQSKIAKQMRNDVLVCRISNKEDVNKINEFLNEKLNYKSIIKPNPFILNNGNISIGLDGDLSYNTVLSTFIKLYLENKRENKELNSVNDKELAVFIEKKLKQIKEEKNIELLKEFKIKDLKEYLDLIRVSYILKDNINNNLSMNKLFKYQNVKNTENIESFTQTFNDEDKEKIIHIINKLTYYYSLEEIHKRIIKYIETGNINLFTRKNNIRKTVSENFTPSLLKNILKEMGWNALLDVSNETYQKYGEDQLKYAVNKLIKENKIDAFTNNNNARSYLGFIIPTSLLIETINDKLENNSLTEENLTNIILKNITIEEERKHGRN